MDTRIDSRLGREIGLEGPYGDVPAFQIINDAASRVTSFTARIVALKYGSFSQQVQSRPEWPLLDRSKVDFNRRMNAVGHDAFAAAVLDAEIRTLEQKVVDSVFSVFES
jgi:hypothetical protein